MTKKGSQKIEEKFKPFVSLNPGYAAVKER